MVFGKFVTEEKDIELVREICRKVFTEELGIDWNGIGKDEFCMNALVFAGEDPAGIGRILFDGSCFIIAGVAVLPEFRGQGYGDFMTRLLVDKAMMANAQEIQLDARLGTEGFFGKIGFQNAGEIFARYGAKWQPMKLKTNQIHKCCNCGH